MTKEEVVKKLIEFQSESTKRVLAKHGAKEPFYGVKVEDLKKIQKQIGKNYALSIELFNTGISDAMYLAGLISEPKKMSRDDLQEWVEKAYWYMLSEYTVAWVASESNFGWELALQWIDSPNEKIQSSGWATLSYLLAITDNAKIDIELIKKLIARVQSQLHGSANRTKYTMNNFIISVGAYLPSLTNESLAVAATLGVIKVDMGGTSCKVPNASEYIAKVIKMGKHGKKRKTAFC